MTSTEFRPPKSYYDIPGFFWWLDRKMFSALLDAQTNQPMGDIVELGTYLGKSAVILGNHLRDEERLVALDLFGSEADTDERNRLEIRTSYSTLSRDLFERYYLSLHDELPYIVQGPSTAIIDHVGENEARFVHIDASHLYAHVSVDVRSTKRILRPGGLAVFDDYRSAHTPGVSAAVWEAVLVDGFAPIAVTPQKMYGLFEGDPEPYLVAIRALVETVPTFGCIEEEVLGRPLLRVVHRDKKKSSAARTISLSDTELDGISERIADRVSQRLASGPTSSVRPGVTATAGPRATRSTRQRVKSARWRDLVPPAIASAIDSRRNP